MVRTATTQEIEKHLIKLGSGNHQDNLSCISGFQRRYIFDLAEHEFMDLVFLQIRTVLKIVPPNHDRRLKAVARRASLLSHAEAHLGPDWDITEITLKFKKLTSGHNECRLPALLLRDTKDSKNKWSPEGWYIQDGSHRALAYGMAILAGQKRYYPQTAFCATTRQLI